MEPSGVLGLKGGPWAASKGAAAVGPPSRMSPWGVLCSGHTICKGEDKWLVYVAGRVIWVSSWKG